MVKYESTKQLSFAEFQTPFEKGIDGKNRWVLLAAHIPWDELAAIYSKSLRADFGRRAINPRVVIGAMIIKHKKSLTDEATIEEIQENPYLQFFLGFSEFTHRRVFDPSLFVTLRKRMGVDAFEQMNQKFIARIESTEQQQSDETQSKSKQKPNAPQESKEQATGPDEQAKTENRGTLIVDATVAPQDIKYPTDLDLLNTCRENTERIIDELYQSAPGKRKPRTYRDVARQEYLAAIRKKRKSGKMIRKAIRKQLNYVKRNIKTLNKLLDDSTSRPISKSSLRQFWIVQEVYRQQQDMYDRRSHQIDDRIVSVSQPHVRPIVRGKSGKDVEFGAKISASLVNGFAYLDRLSWDAYNEGGDLVDQIESYRERFGVYPEVVLGDQIYGTRDNRIFMKDKGIRYSGKALGRPLKLSKEQKRVIKAEARRRVFIEGKFGEGKRKYDLGLVKAKTMNTSESWIAAVFFAMNLAHWIRLYFCAYFLNNIFALILGNFNEHCVRRDTPAKKFAF